MNEDAANGIYGLSEISKYIDDLKFKNAVIGGVDKEDVYVSIREIYYMFTQSYDLLSGRLKQELSNSEQLKNSLKAARSEAAIKSERLEKQAKIELDSKKAELETQNAQKLEKLKTEFDDKIKIAAANARTESANETEERFKSEIEKIRRQLEDKNRELDSVASQLEKAKKAPAFAEKEQLDNLREQESLYEKKLEDLSEKARTRETELTAKLDIVKHENNELQAREAKLNTELNTLKGQLAVKESEIKRRESEYQRELELAKSGTAARGETLEEIYIEARAVRERAIAAAKQKADEIISEAEKEAEGTRVENEAKIRKTEADAARIRTEVLEEADALYAEAQEKADKLGEAAKARGEENDSHCAKLLAEAEQTVSGANAKAAEIISVARQDYQREREKYNTHLTRLSELRTQTVGEIQGAVQKLSGLIFDMSMLGIRADAVNSAELATIDGAVAEMTEANAAAGTELANNAEKAAKEQNDEPENDVARE